MRVAIVRRSAFEDVADKHLFPVQRDLSEQLVEQLPGLADERQPHPILVSARRLADEHQVGVGISGAEHDRGPRLVQRAADAPSGLLVDGPQQLASLGGTPHCRRW
jgi:hypothetical protein